MPLNLEFKARIRNDNSIKNILDKVNAKYLETLVQIDTYYNTKNGRLKIREINNTISQLIYYKRDETEEFRWSDYQVIDVKQVSILKNILEKSLGVKGIIRKRREVYIVGDCRIHLDEVDQLGSFLEFEYIYHDQLEKDVYNFINQLKNEFSDKILETHKESYIDMLLRQES